MNRSEIRQPRKLLVEPEVIRRLECGHRVHGPAGEQQGDDPRYCRQDEALGQQLPGEPSRVAPRANRMASSRDVTTPVPVAGWPH